LRLALAALQSAQQGLLIKMQAYPANRNHSPHTV
jgi:hypothetical protein